MVYLLALALILVLFIGIVLPIISYVTLYIIGDHLDRWR